MSKIITLSSVPIKANRVSKTRPVPFADGLLDTPADAVADGKASWFPTPEGRGLSAAEYDAINDAANDAHHEVKCWARGLQGHELTAIVSQVVRAARHNALKAVLDARPRLLPVAPPEPAPTLPRGFVTRDAVYVPHDAEWAAYLAILDRDEALALEREIEGRYADHAAYEAMIVGRFTDADMMAVGACG